MTEQKKPIMIYAEVVEKCWEDEAYKTRFIENPEEVLSEAGFPVEEGVTYKVVEAPKCVRYIVLPHENTKPAIRALSKEFLNRVEKSDIIVPAGTEVRMIQNTEDARFLILPASPKALSKAELAAVAGGDSVTTTANVALATNVVEVCEVATTVVELEAATTTTTYMAEAEVAVVGIAVAVLI